MRNNDQNKPLDVHLYKYSHCSPLLAQKWYIISAKQRKYRNKISCLYRQPHYYILFLNICFIPLRQLPSIVSFVVVYITSPIYGVFTTNLVIVGISQWDDADVHTTGCRLLLTE